MADHAEHSEYREDLLQEHPYSYDHSEPKYSLIAILGAVTVILLIFVGIGIQYYYEHTESDAVYDRVLSQPSWQLQDLRNKEAWELTHYGTWDKTKGTFRIPVDQAMKLVGQEAAEGRSKYPTNSYEVKTAEQLAAAGGVSQPGAAAAQASQQSGVKSNPNVQPPSTPQQPNR